MRQNATICITIYFLNIIEVPAKWVWRKFIMNDGLKFPLYCFSFFILITFFLSLKFSVYAEEPAQTLETQITISDGQDASVLKDQYVSSKLTLTPGTQITIESSSKIGSIYLIWDIPVPGWTLQADGKTSTHGKNGFLHEYVLLDRPFESITMQIPESGAVLCDITVLSPGTPPSNIQIWEPPLEKADLLLLSTHADDEHLFFGGTMPYYAGEKGLRVQLVYFCSHTMNEPYREHEKLNGMWLQGVKNYPVMGTFPDEYSMDLETALTQYNYDEAVQFIVTQLRRFQPLVVLGQDLNGEYGHGAHRLTAKALTDAVQLSNQPDYDSQTVEQYGLWDVPKTYLHLYPENRIHMNWNIPLKRFGGQTALQMADAGYKLHESQQWCWFYVSDSYEYSCAEFGLFRSLVGPDVIGGDFMENLVPYDQQETTPAAQATTEQTTEEKTTKKRTTEEQIIEKSHSKTSFITETATSKTKMASFDLSSINIGVLIAGIAIIIIGFILIIVCKRKR